MIINELKQRMRAEMLSYTNRDWIKLVMMLAITILLVVYAVLGLYNMLYVINIASDPCGVCKELNPGVEIITNRINIDWSKINLTQ